MQKRSDLPVTSVPPARQGDSLPCIPSEQLFGEHSRLRIAHMGEEYLLQITRQGKLILTK